MIGQQPFGDIGYQNGIPDVGVARPYFLDRQIVREMAGADDFDAVIEDKEPDGGADKVVPVSQGVHQELLEDRFRDFRLSRCIHSASSLDFMDVSHDKPKGVLE